MKLKETIRLYNIIFRLCHSICHPKATKNTQEKTGPSSLSHRLIIPTGE